MVEKGKFALHLALALMTLIIQETGATITFSAPGGATPFTLPKVPENNPPTPITTVVAATTVTLDPVTGAVPAQMYYTLTVVPSDGKFQIDSKTGVITHVPNPNFNFEDTNLAKPTTTERRYVLTVKAFSGLLVLGVLEEQTKTINFDITDVDEPPTITNLPKCLNVYENQAKETIVKLDVNEPDDYKDFNGGTLSNSDETHKFELPAASKEPPGFTICDVHIRTGTPPAYGRTYQDVQCGSFNYELQNNYNMTATAEDVYGKIKYGTDPAHKTREEKIELQVLNINEPPVFYETVSTCEIYENTPIGTTVSTGLYPFRAFDVDKYTGPNCLGKWPDSVEYFAEGKFSELIEVQTVNVTGPKHQDAYFIIKGLFDREDETNPKTGSFNIYVNARDSHGMRNANGGDVVVTCKVLDVDDHPTICKDTKYDITIEENTIFDTKLLTLDCSDRDDVVTNPITYEIKDVGIEAAATLANQYFHFGLSGTSPILTTKREVDLEGGTTMSFTVKVSQGSAFSKMFTYVKVDVTVLGRNDHRPTMDKDFYFYPMPYNSEPFDKIGNVSASDKDQPGQAPSYFLVIKVEGIMLGTASGTLYVDYTNIKAPNIIDPPTLLKNHSYWMSARASDNDKPPYFSNTVFVRVDTYVKKEVLINIEVAVDYNDFSDSQLKDFEKSITNICKPCKGMCPTKSRKGSNTVVTCYALQDDRVMSKHNKEEPAVFMRQDELMDWLTDEKLVAGDIYGFGAYDIVSVTPWGEGPDLLPLWIFLGILLLAALCAGLAFAIKACISHGLCKKKSVEPKPSKPTKHLHPESFDQDTFNFKYADHDKGPF